MAFREYTQGARLEQAGLPPAHRHWSPLLAATRGLAPAGAQAPQQQQPQAPLSQLTLPDGRLNLGTHLPLMAQRYRYLSTLGEGVSAQVLLAEDTLAPAPGRLVAIKVMRRQHALAGQREARTLRFVHGAAPGGVAPGVVRLLDTFSLGAHYCLVTERLYPWLLDWIADSSALPGERALVQLRKIAHQLLVAVAAMHNSGLVHADIKPENILLQHPPGSSSVAVRLVDFGGAFSLTETDTQAVACEVQTLPYRAPEAALGLPYGAAIDLWGVGVVLAEMALKRALLPCASPRDLLLQVAALLGPLPERLVQGSALGLHMDLSALCRGPPAGAAAAPQQLPPELEQRAAAAAAQPSNLQTPAPPARSALHAELAAVDAELADLVLRLLAYDPAQRITAHQALLHPFFDPLCPLRAVFPTLVEAGRLQEAALRSESTRLVEPAGADAPSTAAARAAPAPARPLLGQAPALAAAFGGTEASLVASGERAAQNAAHTPRAAGGASAAALGGSHMPADGRLAAAAAAEAAAAETAAVAAAGSSRDPSAAAGERRLQPLSWWERSPPGRQQQPGDGAAPASMQQQQQQQQQRGQELPQRVPRSQASGARPAAGAAHSAALARPRQPQARLPAAQLAAAAAAEQRRLATSNPYSSGYSPPGPTPAKAAAAQQQQQQQRGQRQQPLMQEVKEEPEEQGSPLRAQLRPALPPRECAGLQPAPRLLPSPGEQQEQRRQQRQQQQLVAGANVLAAEPAGKPSSAARPKSAGTDAATGTAAVAPPGGAGRTRSPRKAAAPKRISSSSKQRPAQQPQAQQRKAAAASAVALARQQLEQQGEEGAGALNLLVEAAAATGDEAAGRAAPPRPRSQSQGRGRPAAGSAAAAAAAAGVDGTGSRRGVTPASKKRRPSDAAGAGPEGGAAAAAAGSAEEAGAVAAKSTGKKARPAAGAQPAAAAQKKPAKAAAKQQQQQEGKPVARPATAGKPRQRPPAAAPAPPEAGHASSPPAAEQGPAKSSGKAPGSSKAPAAPGGSKTPAAKKKRRADEAQATPSAAPATAAISAAAAGPAAAEREEPAAVPATASKRQRREPSSWWCA